MKVCTKCNEERSFDDFTSDKRLRTGKHSWCRQCRADKRLILKQQKYDTRLAAQNGLCALCGLPPRVGERLDTDHDHSCCLASPGCDDCFRGLLHHHCNAAIGFLQDNPRLCRLAADYLERKAPINTSLRVHATPQLPTGSIGVSQ